MNDTAAPPSGRPLSVLFVSHDATLTGAPTMLLRLLRWLVEREKIQPTLILGRSGPLASVARELCPVIEAEPRVTPALQRSPTATRLARALLKRAASRSVVDHGPFDIVYSSTLTTGRLLRRLVPVGSPVVSRVSELGHWLGTRVDPADIAYSLERSSAFICVSRAVERNLIQSYGVDPGSITVLPGFVDRAVEPSQHRSQRLAARARIGLHPDDFVVGGIGTTDWRKGPDLFVQVAAACRRRGHSASFVWIGGGGDERVRLEYDAARAGTNVRFIEHRADAAELAAALDVLCLPSREDPYPIVMLECGAVGVPTVCFADSGGAPEFAAEGGGLAVPYLDVGAMAEAVCQLRTTPRYLRELGSAAHRLVREAHTVDHVAPMIHRLLVRATDRATSTRLSP